MKNNLIKPLTLEIDKNLWEKFKSIITKDKTLNIAVVDLIRNKLKEKDKNVKN